MKRHRKTQRRKQKKVAGYIKLYGEMGVGVDLLSTTDLSHPRRWEKEHDLALRAF